MTTAQARLRRLRGRPLSPAGRVVAFSTTLAALALVLCAGPLAALPPLQTSVDVPFWVLLVAFAATEAFIVHVQFGREAQAFSLAEIPLVVGLVFADPLAVVAARVIGCGAVLLAQRNAVVKLYFNVALFAVETAAVVLLYRALLPSADPHAPVAWFALFAAVTLGGFLGTCGVVAAISLHRRSWRPELRSQIVMPLLATFANANFGVLTVTVLRSDVRAGWLLLFLAGLLLLAYRSYTSLREKHESLQLLQQFTRAVGSSLDAGATTRSLLEQARQLLRAEVAELTLLPTGDDRRVRLRLHADGEISTQELDVLDALEKVVVDGTAAVTIPRTTKDALYRGFLTRRGFRDALLAPLQADETAGVLLVGNRLGELSTFSHDDLRLFETIANHASVLLENGRLVERLRSEVAEKEYRASHDMLTGLANRMLFHDKVAATVHHRTDPFSVMLIDLDRFKEVNDTLGHHTGDLLLQEVGRRLSTTLPSDAVIARLGGDEFALLLPVAEDAAMDEAQRTRAALERPFQLPDLELYVGASIGIAMFPEHGDRAETLLQRADVAMYAAKTQHTGCEMYAPERDGHSHRRLALVSELRAAVERGQLEVYYQPKAELRTGDVVGVEALVRWNHPERGPISPEEFIPVAERTGLIRPLTQHVLTTALDECRRWRRSGLDIGVAVNVSAATLLDAELPGQLSQLLVAAGVAAEVLTLEITESAIMTDPERAVSVLQALSGMGVQLAIDDFGTGYSSLSQLKRLPVDELKIDKSFVLNMVSDDNDAVIVRSTIDLARNLGLRLVAEGVEDLETWCRLQQLGCDVAQGYHLSRPATAQAMEEWLHARAEGRLISYPASRAASTRA